MAKTQDIESRRVYVVKPKAILLERLSKYGDDRLTDILSRLHVIMTEELPFEEYLEGWRSQTLMVAKSQYLEELLVSYPAFSSASEAEAIIGGSNPSVELFDQWCVAEEAEYTELPTQTWRPNKHVKIDWLRRLAAKLTAYVRC